MKEIGVHSLVLEINAYFATTEQEEFARIRERMLLEFMAVIERSGSALALPSRTVHLVNDREPGATQG